MEQLADKGNGNNFYIDSDRRGEARLPGAARPRTLEVVAKDVKLQVDFDPALVARYRLVGYENRDVADERLPQRQGRRGRDRRRPPGHRALRDRADREGHAGERAARHGAHPPQGSRTARRRPRRRSRWSAARRRRSRTRRRTSGSRSRSPRSPTSCAAAQDAEHWSLATIRDLAKAAAGERQGSHRARRADRQGDAAQGTHRAALASGCYVRACAAPRSRRHRGSCARRAARAARAAPADAARRAAARRVGASRRSSRTGRSSARSSCATTRATATSTTTRVYQGCEVGEGAAGLSRRVGRDRQQGRRADRDPVHDRAARRPRPDRRQGAAAMPRPRATTATRSATSARTPRSRTTGSTISSRPRSASTRAQRWKAWLARYLEKGYRAHDPGSNYQAGYLLVRDDDRDRAGRRGRRRRRAAVEARRRHDLGQGDGPRARRARASSRGGDWPEGWQYGPLAVAEYALAMRDRTRRRHRGQRRSNVARIDASPPRLRRCRPPTASTRPATPRTRSRTSRRTC